MTIQLKNPEVADAINNALLDGTEIRLPFTAPSVWVMNGKPQLKQVGGAQYFGGWATLVEEFEPAAEEIGAPIPTNFKEEEFITQDNQTLQVYTTRAVLVAPIAKRLSSVSKLDNTRYPGYHKGASPHLQVVCYLAYKEKKDQIVWWSPIVLSVKGFQCGFLLDAFAKWEGVTAKARREFAPSLKASNFFCLLGTFGDKPIVKQVGAGDKTSPITPIRLYVPDEINEALLAKLFIGDVLAEKMAQLRNDAAAWMDAWKKPAAQTNGETDAEHETYAPLPDEE